MLVEKTCHYKLNPSWANSWSFKRLTTSLILTPAKLEEPLSRSSSATFPQQNSYLHVPSISPEGTPAWYSIVEAQYQNVLSINRFTSWWFQPIWKICSSNWIISSSRGENKKYLSCHHPGLRSCNSSSKSFGPSFAGSKLRSRWINNPSRPYLFLTHMSHWKKKWKNVTFHCTGCLIWILIMSI